MQMSCREALNSAIKEEMYRDERVFVIGEEVAWYAGAARVTKGLHKKFGSRRVIDTPITEVCEYCYAMLTFLRILHWY